MKQKYKENLNLISGSSEDIIRPGKLHTDLSDHNTFMMSPGSLTSEPIRPSKSKKRDDLSPPKNIIKALS